MLGNRIKGAIFDVDGTLLDSMAIWQDAGVRYLESLGIQPSKELGEILYPMTIKEGAVYLQTTYALPLSVSEVIEGISKMVEDFYVYEVSLKEGAAEFLEMLFQKGIPMVLATSGIREHIEKAFQRLHISHYFTAMLTCTEVGAGKTAPLIYEQAETVLRSCQGGNRIERSEIYVFEDALYALETAKCAGFQTVAVYDRFSETDQKVLQEKADIYLSDMKKVELFWNQVS